ncbi:MAG TPA: pyruvate kinase [Anaerolineaceae bacterium]|nr:pyruvate kinase [Anaerolineaceae bacterium]
MDYSILATLGPASAESSVWSRMIESGVTGFRLNTSHMTVEQVAVWTERLGAYFVSLGISLPVALDLQGSKWRLGQFEPFELLVGDPVELVHAKASSESRTLPVPHADFFRAAKPGDQVALNDAKSMLRVESVASESAHARIELGGAIVPRKGITLVGNESRAETLGEKDRAIFEVTRAVPFVEYAISYIKDGEEMASYRRMFGRSARLIGKLERPTAMRDAANVGANANTLWVCRGDLGAEAGLRGMAELVYQFNQQVPSIPVPVILAGQVLEHMTASPTPTRSEVYTIYDALMKGYRGVVLSDEAAVGKFPVEACKAAAMFR